jgi:hypothetical protein
MVGMTTVEVSPSVSYRCIPLQAPLTNENQPTAPVSRKRYHVVIADIHLNRMYRRMEGNVGDYAENVEGESNS